MKLYIHWSGQHEMTRIIINTLCREEITKCYNPVSTACCHCFLSEPPTYDTESRSHTPNPGAGDLGDQSYPPPNICTRRGKQDWLTLQAFVGGFFFFSFSLHSFPRHATPFRHSTSARFGRFSMLVSPATQVRFVFRVAEWSGGSCSPAWLRQ